MATQWYGIDDLFDATDPYHATPIAMDTSWIEYPITPKSGVDLSALQHVPLRISGVFEGVFDGVRHLQVQIGYGDAVVLDSVTSSVTTTAAAQSFLFEQVRCYQPSPPLNPGDITIEFFTDLSTNVWRDFRNTQEVIT